MSQARIRKVRPCPSERSDQRIYEDVCDELSDAPELDAGEIEVRVEQGIVHLDGFVEDRRQKRMAEDVVEHVRGVRDVRNNLRRRDTERRIQEREEPSREEIRH